MAEEEIIAANRLVAIFMGGRFIEDQGKEDVVFSNDENKEGGVEEISLFQVDALEFHRSWDWLMPVLDKIEKMGYKNNLTYQKEGYNCRIQRLEIREHEPDGSGKKLILNKKYFYSDNRPTKIEAVYWTIVKFLEWWNEN